MRQPALPRSVATIGTVAAAVTCSILLSACTPPPPEPGPKPEPPAKEARPAKPEDNTLSSPLAVVADAAGKTLYIAGVGEGDATGSVAVFDIEASRVTRTCPLPGRPSGLALSRDGTRLYATCGGVRGTVEVLDARTGGRLAGLLAGHTPTAPVVSPDGGTLYVCNRFDNDVSVIDLASKHTLARIPVLREPAAAAITPDGKTLFVANFLPVGPTNTGYAAAAVSVIDTSSKEVAATIHLPNGSTSLRGVCVSPDGKHAYVTHGLARWQLPTIMLERGRINTNAFSVIDAEAKTLVNTVLLDKVDRGAANPWGVACTADGRYVCLTFAGTHELCVIDRQGLHDKLAAVVRGEKVSYTLLKPADVPHDLSFLSGLRRWIRLKGKGPRALALVGDRAYVPEYFTDTMSVVDISDLQMAEEEETADDEERVESYRLGTEPEMATVRRGEMLFNEAFCFQKWLSCSTCHPGGRADGLCWDLLHDGMGNTKSTKNLLFAGRTPPSTLMGLDDNAGMTIRKRIKFVFFALRPEEDAAAIEAYVESLRPVPSPRLVDGKPSASAVRGKLIFDGKAGCAECHVGELYADMKAHDVGTLLEKDEGRKYDTPSLVEVWRTPPYLCDGRAVTIMEVLTKFNPGDEHGKTSGLTERELRDLEEYVMSQ
jgi:YVTN family beta-propeller protein